MNITLGIDGYCAEDFSDLELKAFNIIQDILLKAGISYKEFSPEKMSRCICVCTDVSYDFVRFKLGPKVKWISHTAKGYHCDNISIDCVDDIYKYSEEIITAYNQSIPDF